VRRQATAEQPLLQRAVAVEGVVYTETPGLGAGSAYDFRRLLAQALHKHEFKDVLTRAGNTFLVGWLRRGRTSFRTWTDVVEALHLAGALEKRYVESPMGPRALGARPTFASGVKHVVQPEEDENMRHVVSSSTLGKAIEKADAPLHVLNAWLQRHGVDPPAGSGALAVRAAKMRIWATVHNWTGNLFPGAGGSNQASGLLRGPLQAVIDTKIRGRENDEIPIAELKLPMAPRFSWRDFAEHWRMVMADLSDDLHAAGSNGRVRGDVAKALIEEYISNVDLDLPFHRLERGYYDELVRTYREIVAAPADLFGSRGPLDRFMELDWRNHVAPPPDPSAASGRIPEIALLLSAILFAFAIYVALTSDRS
jgi:hypothetical protein